MARSRVNVAERIAKLRMVTVDRGATPAEAAVARDKLALELAKLPPYFDPPRRRTVTSQAARPPRAARVHVHYPAWGAGWVEVEFVTTPPLEVDYVADVPGSRRRVAYHERV